MSKLLSNNITDLRISLVNLAMESVQEVERALSGQGYEITADRSLTVDQILALSPEVLVTEVTPSDLSCCGLISQIKASPDLLTVKIVIIVHGGALERAALWTWVLTMSSPFRLNRWNSRRKSGRGFVRDSRS